MFQPAPCGIWTCSLCTLAQDPHARTWTHNRAHTALLQTALTRTSSTTKINTCERVTLKGCNLQENPIWQSSCQQGSRIDCSRGAHRVASCPYALLCRLHSRACVHTWRRSWGEIRLHRCADKFVPLVLMETCRLAQQASFSFEQGLIFIAPCIDLAWGISVAEQPQGLGPSDTEELEDVGRQKWCVHLSVYLAGWLSKTLSSAGKNEAIMCIMNYSHLPICLSIYLSI